LLFTAASDPGYEPFVTHQPIIDTFSWHPYSWNAAADQPDGVSSRVWEMDPADTTPGGLDVCVPITTDANAQSKIFNYVKSWIAQSGCGREYGAPKDDPNDPGNKIGSPHVPPQSNCVFYSLRGQNCVWWSTIMLQQSGINVNPIDYQILKDFNHGIGNASEVIAGTRSAYEARRVIPVTLDLGVQLPDLGL
jgi:hypothetical protein